jgi:hypothetical protein
MTEHSLSRRKLLLEGCLNWYRQNRDMVTKVSRILERKPTGSTKRVISLRVIEYFLHTFLKNHQEEMFGEWTGADISAKYQRNLKSFGKSNFDLFCRRNKTTFMLFETQVSSNGPQLEFFRWLLSFGLLPIIESNVGRIIKEKRNHGSRHTDTSSSGHSVAPLLQPCNASKTMLSIAQILAGVRSS